MSVRSTCLTRAQSGNQLDQLIQRWASAYGVDVNFAKAIACVESCFNPDVGSSSAHAIGPMQVIPTTAAWMNGLSSAPPEVRAANFRTTEGNVVLGCYYLSLQLATFGDLWQAAGAYNCGPGCMSSAIAKGGQSGYAPYLPGETQRYITDVQGYYQALGGSNGILLVPIVEAGMFGGITEAISIVIDKIQEATSLDRNLIGVGLALTAALLLVTILSPRR